MMERSENSALVCNKMDATSEEEQPSKQQNFTSKVEKQTRVLPLMCGGSIIGAAAPSLDTLGVRIKGSFSAADCEGQRWSVVRMRSVLAHVGVIAD